MAYVYRHIRKDKNQPFYIGIGSDNKFERAYSNLGRNKYWNRITSNTEYTVDILFDDINWDDACSKEYEFIQLYGRRDLGNGTLCNLTDGGEGAYGRKMSEKTKIALIKSNTGSKKSKETIIKMSKAKIGKLKSDETKLKMSKYRTGKKHSESTIKKLSGSNHHSSRKVINIETGIIYDSVSDAAKANNIRVNTLHYRLTKSNKKNFILKFI
jgi:hypothetical protein